MEPTFSQMIKRLEDIVNALESGNTSLEDALSLYEEGSGLIKKCNKTLTDAKLKITDISILDKDDDNE